MGLEGLRFRFGTIQGAVVQKARHVGPAKTSTYIRICMGHSCNLGPKPIRPCHDHGDF